MTPRAVRPARARRWATGLSEARLAVRVRCVADAECIPSSYLGSCWVNGKGHRYVMLATPGWDAVVCGGFRRVAAWPGSGFPNTGLTGAAWLKYFISSYGYLAILLLMAV